MFKKEYTPWNKGKKMSSERAEFLRVQVLKVGENTRFKKGQPSWNKDKKLSKEWKMKLSEAHKRLYEQGRITWNKGKPWSKEIKKKLSDSHKGYVMPKSQKKKIGESLKNSLAYKLALPARNKKVSESLKKRFKDKTKHPLYGKKHSEETKRKMSEAQKLIGARFGSESPNWQGGISKLPYPFIFGKKLKLSIRQRDNFTCQKCWMTEEEHLKEVGIALSINHIDYDKMNCDPKNLNTLCRRCNFLVNANRKYWTNYFQQQMESKILT